MPWFLVDDDFPNHPGVLAISLAARGLWVTAGAWSSKRQTDVVPDHVVASLGGTPELSAELATAKVWKRARGGYRFIQEGTCKIPSREAVENDRKAAAERKRRQRARHADVTPMSRGGKPVENENDQRKPRSDTVMSRRDNGVTSPGPGSDPGLNPGMSVVEVVNLTNGSSPARASPETIESIIKEILDVTGRHITDDWAYRVAAEILQHAPAPPGNPAAYVRQAIRNDPDPKRRFLPLY